MENGEKTGKNEIEGTVIVNGEMWREIQQGEGRKGNKQNGK